MPSARWDVLSHAELLDQIFCRNLLQEVPRIVERTQTLRELVLSTISQAESFIYLREAANCYILGLPQAAVALSRAAVESRLKQACAKVFGSKAVAEADFIELIDGFSVRGRILSKEGRDLAHSVRQAGNDVLHDKPTTSATALQVFEEARKIIQLLDTK